MGESERGRKERGQRGDQEREKNQENPQSTWLRRLSYIVSRYWRKGSQAQGLQRFRGGGRDEKSREEPGLWSLNERIGAERTRWPVAVHFSTLNRHFS